MRIKDSVILITGGAIRVGKAFALHLAGQGANIAFTYFNDSEDWKGTLREIEDKGVKALALQVDSRESSQIRTAVEKTVEVFGTINVLVNNAGIWLKTPFLEIPEEDFDQEIAVNLKGPFLFCQQTAPVMLHNGGGVIINITDISAFQVWPGYAHHAASKSGLVSLTKQMATELAPSIRVNAIAPGTIMLPPSASEEKINWSVQNSLLKRVGKAEEAAQLVQFLIENRLRHR